MAIGTLVRLRSGHNGRVVRVVYYGLNSGAAYVVLDTGYTGKVAVADG